MARSKMIMVRVDEAEHALFKEAARRVSISMSEFARDAMLARMALEEAPRVVVASPEFDSERVSVTRLPEPVRVIKSPGDVPAAVRRVASPEEARAFMPYSKEQQVGKAKGKKLAQAEPVQSCRHGLLRCKVCGTG